MSARTGQHRVFIATVSPSWSGTRLGRCLALPKLLLAAAMALIPVAAMAGSDVVRVPVPAKDVTKLFPAGTGLRVMSPREFEALVEAARRETADARPTAPPRLIRARHRARWESGLLRGRSELVVGVVPAGPVEFALEPWTPAILGGTESAPAVGSRDSGRSVLRIDASPREQTVRLDWELQPRQQSRGRGFSLGLPAGDTTVLELEIPRGWVASSQRGIRRGPIPAEDPSLSLWEIDGEAGRFDIELRDARDRGRVDDGSGGWISGATVVDLRRVADLGGASPSWMVNWTAECRLELDARHPGRLEAELDPGLELIDVQGDAVRGYRTERPGDATRVVVALVEGARSARLRFLANARVPSQGAWPIPAIRPLNATWTGGRTTVVLDELHAVRECRERAGRLVPPGRGDAGATNWLVFEARSPRSVAELDFIRPRAEVTCTVRGQLDLASTPARLDCRLDWRLHRGSIAQMEIDLAPTWLPEQVRIQGLDDPLAWHSSAMPTGATRLRVMLPASVLAARQWTLSIGATSTALGARGSLELPRVHPVGAAIGDEAWLAWGDDSTTIQPTNARGLAWIDPADVPGLVVAPPSPDLREALAWRWTTDDAGARVERERVAQGPRASIGARARLAPDGRGLSIDGTLLVRSGAAEMDFLPIWVDGPGDPLASWRFNGGDGGELRLRPIDEPARGHRHVPADAAARSLPMDLPAGAEKAVSFRASLPWSSPGLVPLLRTTRDSLERATIVVDTPAGMKSRPRAVGLGRLYPSTSEPPRASPGAAEASSPGADDLAARDRIVHAYSYTEPGARLELAAEPMVPAPPPGIVREALLTTSVDAQGRALNRLRLLVQLDQAEPLELDLPDRSQLVRVRRDGTEIVPTRSGARISMPAPAAGHGARSSTIVIDYASDSGPLRDGSVLHPDRPRLDLPCLSFTWELAAPGGWQLLDPGAGLVANDPDDPDDWPCGALGLWKPGWPFPGVRDHTDAAERLGQLDGRLGRPVPEEMSFAEWFSRWDSGPWPVVIDRLALSSAGLGPKSSCFPGRVGADRRNPAGALLQQHGLALVVFPEALLITTGPESARFGRREPWRPAIAEALAWGADRTDRIETVARWRGEISPRGSAAAEEGNERYRLLPGRSSRRFSAAGWPGPDAVVHLADARRRMLTGWIVAGLLAIAWLGASRRAAGRRLFLPALAVAGCVLLERVLPARYGAATAGAFVGALAILITELARQVRRAAGSRSVRAPVRTESSLIRGTARGAAMPVVLVAIGGAVASLHAAPPGADAPIVALFPYEGTFDPARLPDRVILRLDDFRRLTRPADGAAAPRSTVTAVAAAHRIARRTALDILVETEIELSARGRAPFPWHIPVSSAREITATLDGEAVPIAVEPGGTMAKVVLPKAGTHRLRVRRWAAARAEEAGVQILSLPVNPTPIALLSIDPPGDGIPQGEAVARGRIERRPDGSLAGRLGPADRLVVRWAKSGGAARDAGPVDAMILWDVTPAGDRLRAHLTYHGRDEITSVRLAHEAGLVLRTVRAPGAARAYREDSGSDQWLLSFDPPLPPTCTLEIECWRPLPSPLPDAPAVPGAPRGPATRAAAVVRHLPHIQPLGAERFTGILGVRRPGDWTGRLSPLRDTEPINDEAFVKAWGSLPEEPLTLSGTSRFGRELDVELQTGPAPPRVLVIRPAEQLRIESGRIVVAVDADVLEVSGHSPIMEAELPEGLRLTQVAGDGLIDWTVAADRRLHLICQRRGSSARRHFRLLGWIPLIEDPLKIGARPHRVPTPWLGWPGAEVVGPGTLTVSSGTEAQVIGGSGLAPIPAAVSPGTTGGSGAGGTVITTGGAAAAVAPRLMSSYQVDDPDRLGELTWDSRPPRVAVVVESQTTIHPDFAEWVAVVRYDVTGGALDRINLKVPKEWAARAKLHLTGDELPSSAQVVGPSTFWSIVPKRPLWGSHRFVLRSSLPLGTEREFVHPEVAPLGWGAVDAYVGIVNATGQPLAAEDATGLQRLSVSSHFRAREFARDGGTPAGAFRVLQRPWALRVQLPPAAAGPADSGDDAARVSLADISLNVMADRSIVGRALYDVVPDSGRLLNVELPAGSTILWAAVDPNPAVPLRSDPSVWSIVLDAGRPERVCLIWKTAPGEAPAPGPATASGGWSLALPRAGLGSCRTLVSVSSPDGVAIEEVPAGFERVAMARLDKARADRLGQSIRDSLAELDRSSGRDHERLVALLIHHELALRAAERAARRDDSGVAGAREDRELIDSIPTARGAVVEAVRLAGLTDDLTSAQGYLGLSEAAANRPVGGIPEPVAACRIPAFGRPAAMLGVTKGLDEPSSPSIIRFEGGAGDGSRGGEAGRPAIVAAALLIAALLATSLGGGHAPVVSAVSLVVMLTVAALTGGPAMLAGGLGLAAVAWRNDRP